MASQFVSVDGEWGPWTEWGGCSVSCGGGERKRTRNCDSPFAQYGGLECKDAVTDAFIDSQSEVCNTQCCPGKLNVSIYVHKQFVIYFIDWELLLKL